MHQAVNRLITGDGLDNMNTRVISGTSSIASAIPVMSVATENRKVVGLTSNLLQPFVIFDN